MIVLFGLNAPGNGVCYTYDTMCASLLVAKKFCEELKKCLFFVAM